MTTTTETIGTQGVGTIETLLTGTGLSRVSAAVADKVFAETEVDRTAQATAEQLERAETWQTEKAGLMGKALAMWVLTGESAGNGAAKAKAAVERKAVEAKAKKARRSGYPEEITEAVRLAKDGRGTKNGAPGAKQHVLVRKALGKDATTADIIKVAGVKTEKQLRAIADGSSDREAIKALHPLAAKFEDPFCKGRNLASILVAALVQAKAAK